MGYWSLYGWVVVIWVFCVIGPNMVSWEYGLLVLIWVGSWVIGPYMGVVGLLVLKKFLIYLLVMFPI